MSGLSQIGQSPTFWIGTVVIVSYWIATPWIDTNIQTEWLRAILITIGATIGVAYTPGVIKFLTDPSPVQDLQFTMGIVVAWFGTAMAGIYLLFWRMAEQPVWMVNNDLNGWWLWWQIVGGVLHLKSQRSIENEVPRPNVARLWIALLAGGSWVHSRGDEARRRRLRGWYSPLPQRRAAHRASAHVKSCPEGAFTTGPLWMQALRSAVDMLLLIAVLRDLAPSRDPPSVG